MPEEVAVGAPGARGEATLGPRSPDAGEVEVEIVADHGGPLAPADCERAALAALSAAGVTDGHLAIAFVGSERMRELNATYRGIDRPTDVLSFPIDGAVAVAGPRELGDVIVCTEYAAELDEAIVHGVLHLCGHDHEPDDGTMLARQDQILRTLRE